MTYTNRKKVHIFYGMYSKSTLTYRNYWLRVDNQYLVGDLLWLFMNSLNSYRL